MAEEKLLLLVITYARRPRLFFSKTLKVHDPMVTNCYYTFFSTYNLVTTSVYFASTCSLSKTYFASLKFSWLFANFLLMKNRSKFHYICPAWICRFFMDSLRGLRGESGIYVKKPQFKTHIIGLASLKIVDYKGWLLTGGMYVMLMCVLSILHIGSNFKFKMRNFCGIPSHSLDQKYEI